MLSAPFHRRGPWGPEWGSGPLFVTELVREGPGPACSLLTVHIEAEKPRTRASLLSPVWLLETPQTVTRQALPSMRFPRQQYWSGLSFPPPGDLPDSGVKPMSLESSALGGGFFTTEPSGKQKAQHWQDKAENDVLELWKSRFHAPLASPYMGRCQRDPPIRRVTWFSWL